MSSYAIYDVFTEKRFAGNPLAVVLDAAGLPEAALQKIAREFNYSETTFVYPPENPDHTARVRIFTPTQEIPFAGHPAIGTAIALADAGRASGDCILELGVGPIPVTLDEGRARFVTRVPLETWDGPPPDVVARSASLPREAIRLDTHPPVIASVGLPFALAEVTDRNALAAAGPVEAEFRAYRGFWPGTSHFDLMLYLREEGMVHARVFAPLDGVPEDPATGSAAAALAAYLGRLEGHALKLDISQGVDMGRPSRISADVTVEDGAPKEVGIAGAAVQVMSGHLTV